MAATFSKHGPQPALMLQFWVQSLTEPFLFSFYHPLPTALPVTLMTKARSSVSYVQSTPWGGFLSRMRGSCTLWLSQKNTLLFWQKPAFSQTTSRQGPIQQCLFVHDGLDTGSVTMRPPQIIPTPGGDKLPLLFIRHPSSWTAARAASRLPLPLVPLKRQLSSDYLDVFGKLFALDRDVWQMSDRSGSTYQCDKGLDVEHRGSLQIQTFQ